MVKTETRKPKAKATTKPKPRLTDQERHKRFIDMAHKVEADESPEAFDQAFDTITRANPRAHKDQ